MTQPFYNTIGLNREGLQEVAQQATNQEEIVLAWFKRNGQDRAWPTSKCHLALVSHYHIPESTPITSIRRAISNLTKKGRLIKLAETYKGPLGKPEHLIIYNPSQPSQ